ncbi:Bifunctional enzyme CysN/CysC [Pseudovibrio sp. Ad13]|uniref:sulfate adenylyltransferase subunit CysN n=1 Tax=Pseudovibrio sp. Ad13 TaxID=989396 RepID=UPI0007AE73EF|nr:sulfate adenylyltransferase subunit CysN [Pseudovibrio sp. Ad13]KZK84780.1 Bifunctional enzyme CysN/CysC [Pseudovibrio sp. Ad13]
MEQVLITPQTTVSEYLQQQSNKSLLRFITCGSVDDGKSTLIGRLLYDSKLLFDDQLATLERESKRRSSGGEDIDFSLLVDGLEAEREQGITIDVAYRFFTTDKRKFIVADTPGHEQYTRNMATGASSADLAVILVDARKGILQQTRRHSFIASLLGVQHVVLAINKIDLVDFSERRFAEILEDYKTFSSGFDFSTFQAIPISAKCGDNVTLPSENMHWYSGPTLLDHLEHVSVDMNRNAGPFRMPVQWVNRPNLDFRGFAGTVAGGTVRPGDEIVVAKSGKTSRIASIVSMDGDLPVAVAGDAVTLTLVDEIDASRGDMFASPQHRPEVADQFAAHLIWMEEQAMHPGRSYLLKIGRKTVTATVTEIKHKVDVNTFQNLAAKNLELNEIAFCSFSLSEPVAFDPYEANKQTGSFILIDRFTNQTVGAGMIWFALRRSSNIHWQALDVDKQARSMQMQQKPVVLWFTGLSGSGKSTVANLVEKRLCEMDKHTMLLDGDNVRHGLNRDLGFTDSDRVENIRRVAEVSKLFVEAGLITLVSFISPFKSERKMAREILEAGEFVEIFVNTSIEECRKRDPKGLYAKADRGELKNFTGVDATYERPESAEVVLYGDEGRPEALADQVFNYLGQKGYL